MKKEEINKVLDNLKVKQLKLYDTKSEKNLYKRKIKQIINLKEKIKKISINISVLSLFSVIIFIIINFKLIISKNWDTLVYGTDYKGRLIFADGDSYFKMLALIVSDIEIVDHSLLTDLKYEFFTINMNLYIIYWMIFVILLIIGVIYMYYSKKDINLYKGIIGYFIILSILIIKMMYELHYDHYIGYDYYRLSEQRNVYEVTYYAEILRDYEWANRTIRNEYGIIYDYNIDYYKNIIEYMLRYIRVQIDYIIYYIIDVIKIVKGVIIK